MSIHCVSRNSISGFICEVFFCGFLMLARSQICADSKSCFHSGDLAVAMEPTNDELSAFVAIEDVATWAGMQGDILASLKLALGNPPNLRVLACMPISVFEAATSGWQITTGKGDGASVAPASATDMAMAFLISKATRLKMGLPFGIDGLQEAKGIVEIVSDSEEDNQQEIIIA